MSRAKLSSEIREYFKDYVQKADKIKKEIQKLETLSNKKNNVLLPIVQNINFILHNETKTPDEVQVYIHYIYYLMDKLKNKYPVVNYHLLKIG